MRIHRRRRQISRAISSPGTATHHKKVNYTRPKPGQGVPKVSSINVTTTTQPASTVTTSEQEGGDINVGSPIKGNASGVMVAAALLLVASQWRGFFGPLMHNLFWPDNFERYDTNLGLIAGGVVFVIAVGVLASISADSAGVMWLMVIAMWILFIMFEGQNTVKDFLNQLSSTSNIGQVTGILPNQPSSQQSQPPPSTKGTGKK